MRGAVGRVTAEQHGAPARRRGARRSSATRPARRRASGSTRGTSPGAARRHPRLSVRGTFRRQGGPPRSPSTATRSWRPRTATRCTRRASCRCTRPVSRSRPACFAGCCVPCAPRCAGCPTRCRPGCAPANACPGAPRPRSPCTPRVTCARRGRRVPASCWRSCSSCRWGWPAAQGRAGDARAAAPRAWTARRRTSAAAFLHAAALPIPTAHQAAATAR